MHFSIQDDVHRSCHQFTRKAQDRPSLKYRIPFGISVPDILCSIQALLLILALAQPVITWPPQSLRSKRLDHPFSFSYEARTDLTATLTTSWQRDQIGVWGTRKQSPKHPLPSQSCCLFNSPYSGHWQWAPDYLALSTLMKKRGSKVPSSFRKLGCLPG